MGLNDEEADKTYWKVVDDTVAFVTTYEHVLRNGSLIMTRGYVGTSYQVSVSIVFVPN